ncbi:bifunctional (p)ppGpp synthetase/guanosine-3',5'-bis(diphosphate) 3'-pyrophosphohydrolase [Allobranchiibius sp. GilTou73]|uniref:RelA/SpoT family protein n=1 Tax=Allobranchiibius sp. GilTou73 TaxID=2904523 RepID=UPI001F20D1B5|nr:bifunctional (p)ppGpp synthetase/guanosine-3',5'-bis(diphosphate) 3'-pyrophosphohydrolase [Allobranchiibius sp. GilTou73]UIJ34075.1 bifunctional (p)ppGpp synthetase/guanosine-3',5'-bis(diphosphate) 3'-pyrophosphohydrolase [Allobranchiibius sp. GilTou73]
MSAEDGGATAAPSSAAASAAASRVRARLVRFSGPRSSSNRALEPLLRTVGTTHPKADVSVIERAYAVAERCHEGQLRKSGDPYITHPMAVATILAELGMTPPTLAAALLHDTVEDTAYSLDQLKTEFGAEIAMLVDGVTKLDKVKYGDAAQAETVRKMVVAMARDIRVLVIKLADRLHNARTWRYVSVESAQRKATETLEIFAPLAHRLGMNTIKWELEDLSFATLYPKVYDEIARLVADRAPAREEYLKGVGEQVSADLRSAKIKATVTGRPKHYYSVYQKMIVRGRDFEEIYDLVAVRVLVESVRDCYAVLGTLHTRWSPVPGRFKDYIAMPKFNMYQSLHTTVIGPEGKPVEIQIRTYQMHRRAEYGVAAHWKYKEDARAGAGGSALDTRDGPVNDMAWLRQLLEWQRETSDPGEFLESLRFEVGSREVYVFTPKGEVMGLPAGSTPVDFAYAVHTEVGHHTIGGRVNGRLVPLESPLENGDVVEVLTSKADGAGPSRDWLNFVKSPRARNKIRQWFSRERREEAIESGKEALAKNVRKQGVGLQRLMSHDSLTEVATGLHYHDIDTLYAAIGDGHVSADHVVSQLLSSLGGEEATTEDLAEATIPHGTARRRQTDPGVTVVGTDDVWVKLARCCTPVPGDDIIGFVTTGNGVSVHRSDCKNVEQLRNQPERILAVAWSPSAASVFLVQLQVEALDRNALLSDVTRVLSDQHVNILSASVATSRNRVALSKFTFEMGDPSHLNHVIQAVRKIDGVFDVYRITGSGHRRTDETSRAAADAEPRDPTDAQDRPDTEAARAAT